MGDKRNPFAVLSAILAVIILLLGALWFQYANGGFPFNASGSNEGSGALYTCPMHPSYITDSPGECPICGMDLVPVEEVEVSEASVEGYATFGISTRQRQLIGMKTEPVKREEVGKILRTVGMVELDEGGVHHVHTRYSGWIERVFIAGEGDPVYEGQALFSIYSPELYTSQRDYLLLLEGSAELRGSSRAEIVNRSEALLESSRNRLVHLGMTERQIEHLAESAEVETDIVVYSPAGGYVKETKTEPGMYVQPGTELFTIVDTSRVWILADVYERDLPFIHPGQPATLDLPFDDREPLAGRVDYVYPYLEGGSRTVKVRFDFPNPTGELLPMMYVNVELEVDLGERLTVPNSAVMSTGERRIVFLSRDDGHIEPREITVLTDIGERTVVTGGLDEGEVVVISGNFLIDSESQLKAALAQIRESDSPEASSSDGMDHQQHIH